MGDAALYSLGAGINVGLLGGANVGSIVMRRGKTLIDGRPVESSRPAYTCYVPQSVHADTKTFTTAGAFRAQKVAAGVRCEFQTSRGGEGSIVFGAAQHRVQLKYPDGRVINSVTPARLPIIVASGLTLNDAETVVVGDDNRILGSRCVVCGCCNSESSESAAPAIGAGDAIVEQKSAPTPLAEEPHRIWELCRQVEAHPDYGRLPEHIRGAFQAKSRHTKENNKWRRQLWRHLYVGAPLP